MLSYQTPATIKAANAEAFRVTAGAGHVKGTGVDHNAPRGSRSESLANAHAEALARRKAG